MDGASDGYIRGYFEITLQQFKTTQQCSIPTKPDWFDPQTTTNASLVKEMDRLYQDGANISLPMVYVFQYSEMKLSGATKQQLDELLTRAHQIANKVSKGDSTRGSPISP